MAWVTRSLVAVIAALALVAPAAAIEGRTFACVDTHGGGAFALVLGSDSYSVQSEPDAPVQLSGEGSIINDPERSYLMIGSGPLKDQWQVENLYQMSGSGVTLSGERGLIQCRKSKLKPQ